MSWPRKFKDTFWKEMESRLCFVWHSSEVGSQQDALFGTHFESYGMCRSVPGCVSILVWNQRQCRPVTSKVAGRGMNHESSPSWWRTRVSQFDRARTLLTLDCSSGKWNFQRSFTTLPRLQNYKVVRIADLVVTAWVPLP